MAYLNVSSLSSLDFNLVDEVVSRRNDKGKGKAIEISTELDEPEDKLELESDIQFQMARELSLRELNIGHASSTHIGRGPSNQIVYASSSKDPYPLLGPSVISLPDEPEYIYLKIFN